ncbi:hypothetical protein GWI33_018676 [Rhynchophorus ferrugineus]|uniref:Uncharacterized protein n=1 Tax=Rhynchophorus ferrugineus TaxID=354439 RepID=A0A834HT08_RHYFE|nr:hypothetical protein GWI33_018676 [Rhynchophorus ferrugineus]
MDALCLVCLTNSTDKRYYSLLTIFPEFSDKCLCILDLLTLVTSSEVIYTENLPNSICIDCFKSLKMAYEFIILYEASQVTLTQDKFQSICKISTIIGNAAESKSEENIFILTEDTCDNSNIVSDHETVEEIRNADNNSDDKTKCVECPAKALSDVVSSREESTQINDSSDDSFAKFEIILIEYEKLSKETQKNANHICAICNNQYESLLKLKAHRKHIHNPKWKEKFKCPQCDQQCKTMSGFRYHMRKHDGKKFACGKCDKVYLTTTLLNEHIRRVHENKLNNKFFCEVCAKGFKFKNALEYHMHLHTNTRNFVCRFCGFRSVTCSALKRHERTHTGERPYNCRYCQLTFAGSAERLKHELGHKGVYPYKCKYCQKPFIQMYNMRVHWLQHTGSCNCDICGKTFIEQEVLKFHYSYTHKIKM